MKLTDILTEKRTAIVKRWFDITLEAYPEESSGFLRNQKKQFANPVGFTLSQGLEGIFDGLIRGLDFDKFLPFLDGIIRIRAVQGLNPSQALSFMFRLKGVIREELRDQAGTVSEEVLDFESRIDALALISFDIYMKCREKIYDLKANEVRNMTYRLLQKANLVSEVRE